MGDACHEIWAIPHTYYEAVQPQKKRPKSKVKKTPVFQSTSGHPQIFEKIEFSRKFKENQKKQK